MFLGDRNLERGSYIIDQLVRRLLRCHKKTNSLRLGTARKFWLVFGKAIPIRVSTAWHANRFWYTLCNLWFYFGFAEPVSKRVSISVMISNDLWRYKAGQFPSRWIPFVFPYYPQHQEVTETRISYFITYYLWITIAIFVITSRKDHHTTYNLHHLECTEVNALLRPMFQSAS